MKKLSLISNTHEINHIEIANSKFQAPNSKQIRKLKFQNSKRFALELYKLER